MSNIKRLKTRIEVVEKCLKNLKHQLAIATKPSNPGRWEPYVNPLNGGTCDYSARSDCCDSGVHNGTWDGKFGYMCQKCSTPCKRVSKYL